MSAALRINNERKSTKISLPSESPFKDSGTSSPKNAAKKSRNRLRSPSPTMEHPLTPKSSTASSRLDKAKPVADQDQVVCVDPSAQAAGATSDLPSANPSVMHASSLYAEIIPVIDATSVASNTPSKISKSACSHRFHNSPFKMCFIPGSLEYQYIFHQAHFCLSQMGMAYGRY
jgi:hypothetical protein